MTEQELTMLRRSYGPRSDVGHVIAALDDARAIARRLRFWAVDRKMSDAEFAEKTAYLAQFDALPWATDGA